MFHALKIKRRINRRKRRREKNSSLQKKQAPQRRERSLVALKKSHSQIQKRRLSIAIFVIASFAFLGFYLAPKKDLSAPKTMPLNIIQKTEERVQYFKWPQKMKQQEGESYEAQKNSEFVDSEPMVSPLDIGVHIPKNSLTEEIVKKLDEKPFENDLYEDPEDIVLQTIEHQEWLEEQLARRNTREQEEFIDRVVRNAREQGYNVYFTKDLRLILEPMEKEERKPAEFDKVKINWK